MLAPLRPEGDHSGPGSATLGESWAVEREMTSKFCDRRTGGAAALTRPNRLSTVPASG